MSNIEPTTPKDASQDEKIKTLEEQQRTNIGKIDALGNDMIVVKEDIKDFKSHVKECTELKRKGNKIMLGGIGGLGLLGILGEEIAQLTGLEHLSELIIKILGG